MISLFHKYRSEILLFALIAQIVASPLADSHPLIGAFIAVVVLSLVLVGIFYLAVIVARMVLYYRPRHAS